MTDPLLVYAECLQSLSAESSLELAKIRLVAGAAATAVRQGQKVVFLGNGGSAAQAAHFAAELTGQYEIKGRRAIAALALAQNSAEQTALGNDFGWANSFSRAVDALFRPGDVLIALSTSGRSGNVLNAIAQVRSHSAHTSLWTGYRDVPQPYCDACHSIIHSQSIKTPRIQEFHQILGHLFCGALEEKLHGTTAA